MNDRICNKGDETYYLSYSSNMFNQLEYPTSAKQGNDLTAIIASFKPCVGYLRLLFLPETEIGKQ